MENAISNGKCNKNYWKVTQIGILRFEWDEGWNLPSGKTTGDEASSAVASVFSKEIFTDGRKNYNFK